MVMAATPYKSKDMKDSDIATATAYGFICQLKSWWDNFLIMQQKLDILNHSYKIKREEDHTEVIIEDGHDVLTQFLIILLVVLQNIKPLPNLSLLTYDVLF